MNWRLFFLNSRDSQDYTLQWRRPTIQPTVAHVKIMSNDLRWMTNEINQFSKNEETKFQYVVFRDTFYTNKSGWKIIYNKKNKKNASANTLEFQTKFLI